jgi:hypothetical protein
VFDPAPHQPLQVFFDLQLGGLERIYERPNIPVSFSMHLSASGVIGDFQMTLFDEAGFEVEPYIWQSRNQSRFPEGRLKFGYKGSAAGIESEEYLFMSYGYKPTFEDNAFSINMFGTGHTGPISSCNPISGTVEQILKEFCRIHEMELEIDPPLGPQHMQETGRTNRDTTEPREMKHSKISNEPDWRYLNRILYHAVDQEGKHGYRPFLTSKGGRRLLRVIRPKMGTSKYRYIVQEKSSVVLSWRPDITFMGPFDENDSFYHGHERNTGAQRKVALNRAVTESFQETFDQDITALSLANPPQEPPDQLIYRYPEKMPKNVTKNSIRSRHGGTTSGFAGINPIVTRHVNSWLNANSAVLKIAGDPRVEPGYQCEVLFYYPMNFLNQTFSNRLHYTSDLYWVTDVIHDINPFEGFTTTLIMVRAGMPKAPEHLAKDSGGGFGNNTGGDIA